MIFSFPKHNFPGRFVKIHEELQKQGILGSYGPRFTFPDEPQFFQYACERIPYSKHVKKGLGFGCSSNDGEAFVVAVAEAIEHYCLLFEQDNIFTRGSYKNLRISGAIDPFRFNSFSQKQLEDRVYKKFRFDHKTEFNWLEGYSLTKKKKVLVPASVVYANYSPEERGEPTIQLKNSTGAACGSTLEFALYRGICEIIERDAYMISFIQNLPKAIINVDTDEYLATFKRRIERYDLEVHFLHTSLDCSPTTVVCIILDRTGSGPVVCTGLGGNLDPRKAIETAGFEALRRHISARDRFFRSTPLPLPVKYSFDWFLLKKQQLWAAPHMITTAKAFLNGGAVAFGDLQKHVYKTDKERVSSLVVELKEKGHEVIYVDVTLPAVRALGLTVVKVLIPEMVPLWRDERYPYLGIPRLYDLPKQLGYEAKPIELKDVFSVHPF